MRDVDYSAWVCIGLFILTLLYLVAQGARLWL